MNIFMRYKEQNRYVRDKVVGNVKAGLSYKSTFQFLKISHMIFDSSSGNGSATHLRHNCPHKPQSGRGVIIQRSNPEV